jgi:hypothetical protein
MTEEKNAPRLSPSKTDEAKSIDRRKHHGPLRILFISFADLWTRMFSDS